jgi:hypothetical protein
MLGELGEGITPIAMQEQTPRTVEDAFERQEAKSRHPQKQRDAEGERP